MFFNSVGEDKFVVVLGFASSLKDNVNALQNAQVNELSFIRFGQNISSTLVYATNIYHASGYRANKAQDIVWGISFPPQFGKTFKGISFIISNYQAVFKNVHVYALIDQQDNAGNYVSSNVWALVGGHSNFDDNNYRDGSVLPKPIFTKELFFFPVRSSTFIIYASQPIGKAASLDESVGLSNLKFYY